VTTPDRPLSGDDATLIRASSAPAAAPGGLAPGDRIAHYRVDERLGAGGMGEVYRAWDLALDRPAAVKVIRSSMDAMFTKRLLREVEAAARLQHPAIATFFEGGEDAGRAYFAMELVAGSTLRYHLHGGAMEPPLAMSIAAGLLDALAHAHGAGLLHRDIKPENIMITPAGAPKLLDFGLARRMLEIDPDEDSSALDMTTRTVLTAHGTNPGTPGYMSPEQLRALPLGPSSDLFQVGAILYEMLTGARAFGQGSVVSRVAATLATPPDPSPLSLRGLTGLAAITARALAPKPEDRYQTASDFLMALEALASGRLRTTLPSSIVVPDFANLTGDAGNDWIGAGLADSLTTDLSGIAGITVARRSVVVKTMAALRQTTGDVEPASIAVALSQRWAVGGSYQRAAGRLRVSWRVIDAATGAEAVAGRLEGTLDGLFDVQDRLAQAVADALDLSRQAAASQPARSPQVLELTATARELHDKGARDVRLVAMFEEAIALEPDHLPALSGLAGAYATRFIATGDEQDLARAIEVADRALAIDPGNTEAWSWRGYALMRQGNDEAGFESFRRVIALGTDNGFPHYMYGSGLGVLGRHEEALPHIQRSVRLDPGRAIGWCSLGWSLQNLGRYREARHAYERALALEGQPGPNFLAGVGGFLADCLAHEGHLEDARAAARAGLESIERSNHMYRDTIRGLCLNVLGRISLELGDRDAAQAAFAQAIAQTRGRSKTLGGGHVLVQALAGLARVTGDPAPFEEAQALFDTRIGYSFKGFYGCTDAPSLLELARAAAAVGRPDDARAWMARARAAGNPVALAAGADD